MVLIVTEKKNNFVLNKNEEIIHRQYQMTQQCLYTELNIFVKYCHILIFYKCQMTGTFFLALSPITARHFSGLRILPICSHIFLRIVLPLVT